MKHVLDLILLYIGWVVVFFFGQVLFSGIQDAYYTYAPIENFYENVSFQADNACIGDTYHLVRSIRHVKGTEIGYGGELVREMYLYKSGEPIKILEEHAMPFLEVRADGMVTRQQPLPPNLEVGEYQWIMYLTLNVHGVQRNDIPPIVSNLFNITPCV